MAQGGSFGSPFVSSAGRPYFISKVLAGCLIQTQVDADRLLLDRSVTLNVTGMTL